MRRASVADDHGQGVMGLHSPRHRQQRSTEERQTVKG